MSSYIVVSNGRAGVAVHGLDEEAEGLAANGRPENSVITPLVVGVAEIGVELVVGGAEVEVEELADASTCAPMSQVMLSMVSTSRPPRSIFVALEVAGDAEAEPEGVAEGVASSAPHESASMAPYPGRHRRS